eukprot:PhF_6_TR34950/c0_g1_i2/m.50683
MFRRSSLRQSTALLGIPFLRDNPAGRYHRKENTLESTTERHYFAARLATSNKVGEGLNLLDLIRSSTPENLKGLLQATRLVPQNTPRATLMSFLSSRIMELCQSSWTPSLSDNHSRETTQNLGHILKELKRLDLLHGMFAMSEGGDTRTNREMLRSYVRNNAVHVAQDYTFLASLNTLGYLGEDLELQTLLAQEVVTQLPFYDSPTVVEYALMFPHVIGTTPDILREASRRASELSTDNLIRLACMLEGVCSKESVSAAIPLVHEIF